MAVPAFWRSSLDPERVMNVGITHWQEDQLQQCEDQLTIEEPLEVRIDRRSLAVIMRTPGHDHELAAGFLFTEGVVRQFADILVIEDAVDAEGLPLANVVNIVLRPIDSHAVQSQPVAFERHFAVSASCGLCGKNSIADLMLTAPPLTADDLHIPASIIYSLPLQLRTAQAVFTHTGGLHAAGLFDTTGKLHARFPYSNHILMVSGRTSYEIIQKALLARIPCVAAISAPSSLAVELADRSGITLIGFLRNHSMNVYTHPRRIV
jgi:FdhD protein